MSSLQVDLNNCYDFLDHCDKACTHLIVPYINDIQRTLFQQHGRHNAYRQIPFVIQSICCAYYCHHIAYRLAFKRLFSSYPTHQHFLCQHAETRSCNWVLCPSIRRIIHILCNYQQYVISASLSTVILSPFITYKYYQIQQIITDLDHIHVMHPSNAIKFYIRSKVVPLNKNKPNCYNQCMHDTDDTQSDNDDIMINSTEEWVAYTLCMAHKEYIHHSLSKKQFEHAVSHIISYNENVFNLLNVLRNVCRKLAKKEQRYRTLDTTNPLVQERLLGYEGVIHFLSLLGFESNSIGSKLTCAHPPNYKVIQNAIATIDAYNPKMRPSNDVNDGEMKQIPPMNPMISSQRMKERISSFKHMRIRSLSKEDAKQLVCSVKRKWSQFREHSTVTNMDTMDDEEMKKRKKVINWIQKRMKSV